MDEFTKDQGAQPVGRPPLRPFSGQRPEGQGPLRPLGGRRAAASPFAPTSRPATPASSRLVAIPSPLSASVEAGHAEAAPGVEGGAAAVSESHASEFQSAHVVPPPPHADAPSEGNAHESLANAIDLAALAAAQERTDAAEPQTVPGAPTGPLGFVEDLSSSPAVPPSALDLSTLSNRSSGRPSTGGGLFCDEVTFGSAAPRGDMLGADASVVTPAEPVDALHGPVEASPPTEPAALDLFDEPTATVQVSSSGVSDRAFVIDDAAYAFDDESFMAELPVERSGRRSTPHGTGEDVQSDPATSEVLRNADTDPVGAPVQGGVESIVEGAETDAVELRDAGGTPDIGGGIELEDSVEIGAAIESAESEFDAAVPGTTPTLDAAHALDDAQTGDAHTGDAAQALGDAQTLGADEAPEFIGETLEVIDESSIDAVDKRPADRAEVPPASMFDAEPSAFLVLPDASLAAGTPIPSTDERRSGATHSEDTSRLAPESPWFVRDAVEEGASTHDDMHLGEAPAPRFESDEDAARSSAAVPRAATGPGEAVALGESALQDVAGPLEAREHAAAVLEMVARRVRGGDIVPSIGAGASSEAVLASVLASILSTRA